MYAVRLQRHHYQTLCAIQNLMASGTLYIYSARICIVFAIHLLALADFSFSKNHRVIFKFHGVRPPIPFFNILHTL